MSSPPLDFDSLWDFSDPAGTEGKFRDVLGTLDDDADPAYRLQLLTQIARSQGLQRQFDAAHETLGQVKGELDETAPVVRVRYLLERGRVFNSAGKPDQAKPLFVQAWEIAREHGEDAFAVDAAHMLGIVEPPAESLEWNQRALEAAEASSDEKARRWLGSLYNNIGWTYHDQGDFLTALDLFEKALALRVEQGQPGPIQVARWCVARCLRSLERTDEALAIQQQLLDEHQRAGSEDGFVYEELAGCHLTLGHADEARRYFAVAYQHLSQDPWLTEQEPERIARLKKLGDATS